MLVCAKRDGRGLAGHAHSPDLREWTVAPPISEPTGHFHLEVPQLAHLGGAWRLIFSDDRAGSGIHYLTAPERLGPFPAESRDLLPGARPRHHYAGRVFGDALFTWVMDDEDGVFVGELSDPLPLPAL